MINDISPRFTRPLYASGFANGRARCVAAFNARSGVAEVVAELYAEVSSAQTPYARNYAFGAVVGYLEQLDKVLADVRAAGVKITLAPVDTEQLTRDLERLAQGGAGAPSASAVVPTRPQIEPPAPRRPFGFLP
jgi:hypothetical protein